MQGESSAEKWELVSSLGHTTLTVGSGADCNWVVREEGVRPLHFSLHWDGNTLRVADVYSAGDVRVDGALLTSQWRPLLGRVRLDFGNAAMVVETSATVPGQADHPLDLGRPKTVSSQPPRSASANETLLGVAPKAGGAPVLHGYVPGRPSSQPPAAAGGPDLIRPSSRASADRSMKATLVGGIVVGPGSQPPPSSPSAAPSPAVRVVGTPSSMAPKPGRDLGPKTNATLMGFSVVDQLRGAVGTQPSVQVGSPSVESGTSGSGFPPSSSRRMTQKGVGSQAPGAPDLLGSSPPPGANPAARINSAWQENADAAGGPYGGSGTMPGGQDAPRLGGRTRSGDFAERLSDIPTQMRDPATFSSRRPNQGIPWRYVGVLVLTGVAYFAWLYLLDHF